MTFTSRILGASALALVLFSQGAFADSATVTQLGQTDQAYITQTASPNGYGVNTAHITQDTGSVEEFAMITQGGPNGGYAEIANIYQNGAKDSAEILQLGQHDTADIYQGTGGYKNVAKITQDASSRTEYAAIMQTAGSMNNYAEIYQNGTLDQAGITQAGNDNTAYIYQGKGGLSFMNVATIDQNGVNNKATVDQIGSNDTAIVTQVGSNHTASVIQH
jgi:trimeric autotransporter adhesin